MVARRTCIFFLERVGELRVVVLIDRKIGPSYNAESTAWVSFLLQTCLMRGKQPHTHNTAAHKLWQQLPQRLCPAIFQDCSFISCCMGWASGWQPSKMLRLRIFQIDQAVRITREFSPFLAAFGALHAAHLHLILEV
jgi:hypothetical protein